MRTLESFTKYAGVGAIGTSAHYAVLIGLVECIHLPAAIATALGAIFGAAVNYLLNYRYTFHSSSGHAQSVPRFLIVALAGAAINSAIVYLLVRWGAHYLPGQIAATLLVLMLGYVANSLWTFSGRANGKSPTC